jgi:hypothetical protein
MHLRVKLNYIRIYWYEVRREVNEEINVKRIIAKRIKAL